MGCGYRSYTGCLLQSSPLLNHCSTSLVRYKSTNHSKLNTRQETLITVLAVIKVTCTYMMFNPSSCSSLHVGNLNDRTSDRESDGLSPTEEKAKSSENVTT